jgi:hypothetical protein
MLINIILENNLYREKFINNNLSFKLVLTQIGFIESITTISFKKEILLTNQILKNITKYSINFYV